MLDVVRVTISKTADGRADYLQLISADLLSVNVVVVAGRIEIKDSRPKEKGKK